MRLKAESLKRVKKPAEWKFKSSDDIKDLDLNNNILIGQGRAAEAMEFGLAVASQTRGYNIFITGEPGSGRTSYALERLKELAAKLPAPDDLLYLYNFDEVSKPVAVTVPVGQGKKLAKDLGSLVNELKDAIGKAFEQTDYDAAKAKLVRSFQENAEQIMNELKAAAEKNKFALKRTPQGFINIPLKTVRGKLKEIEPDEFDKLSEKRQKYYHDLSDKVTQETIAGLRVIRGMEKDLKDKLDNLEAEICREAVEPLFDEIKGKYEGLTSWFDAMLEDVVKNCGMFIAASNAAAEEFNEIDFSRYDANVFVSNDPEAGAPVIRESNPTYSNIAGKIEYAGSADINHQAYLHTDFKRIIAGALHRANGGFLLIDAEKVLMNYMSWEAIKRVLNTGESVVENLDEQYGFFHVASLKPQAVKLNLKVIMTGSYRIYELLKYYDPEFQKLFKIKASFDFDMPRNAESEYQMARCAAGIIKRENLPPFDASALSEVIEWAGREAEDQDLLDIKLGKLRELLIEAGAWAKLKGKNKFVTREHVKKAIEQKIYRSALYQEKLTQAFKNKVLRIDTHVSAIGQINGLSIIEMSDYRFGHPSRITANVFMGQEGVVNIEREVKMTGPIHNKGIMILSSYLGRKYAQDMPLALSARITFEQNYGGIEGDSASSTELYCILSALADLPLSQEIAVTGSVDQFGNVQAIGGVNEKIEGFFECCKINGLTGSQGVMIPAVNARNLMLNDEVIDAVRAKKFNIWTVDNIDEGIELLTGVKADKAHKLVKARLKKMLEDNLKLERRGSKKHE